MFFVQKSLDKNIFFFFLINENKKWQQYLALNFTISRQFGDGQIGFYLLHALRVCAYHRKLHLPWVLTIDTITAQIIIQVFNF